MSAVATLPAFSHITAHQGTAGSFYLGHVEGCTAHRGQAHLPAAEFDPYDAWPCKDCISTSTKPVKTMGVSIDKPERTNGAGPAKPTGDITWAKIDGNWLVKVPAGKATTGDKVTISKRDGSKVDAVLGAREAMSDDGWHFFAAAKADKPEVKTVDIVVPDGCYAVDAEAGHTSFYRVKAGRKPGVVFVDLLIGGGYDSAPKAQPVAWAQKNTVLAKIARAGIEEAATRYGVEMKRCHVCNRQLTDAKSRALGIGPDCRGER